MGRFKVVFGYSTLSRISAETSTNIGSCLPHCV